MEKVIREVLIEMGLEERNGMFVYDYYFNGNDKVILEDTIEQILINNEDATLNEVLEELDEGIDNIERAVYEELQVRFDEIIDKKVTTNLETQIHVYDYVEVCVQHGYEEVIKSMDINVDITLETEQEKNMDGGLMGSLSFMIHEIINDKEDRKEYKLDIQNSGLNLLLVSQGYELDDFLNAYKDKEIYASSSKFIQSLVDEVDSFPNMTGSIAFPCKMNLHDYLLGNKGFTIDKDTLCGIVSFYVGGGSLLNVQLEKDIEVSSGNWCKEWDVNKYNFTVSPSITLNYSIDYIYGDIEYTEVK